MMSPVEHHTGPSTVEWHYDGDRDAIVVTTTNMAYTILYLGLLNDAATTAPLALTPATLPEFL